MCVYVCMCVGVCVCRCVRGGERGKLAMLHLLYIMLHCCISLGVSAYSQNKPFLVLLKLKVKHFLNVCILLATAVSLSLPLSLSLSHSRSLCPSPSLTLDLSVPPPLSLPPPSLSPTVQWYNTSSWQLGLSICLGEAPGV